MVYCGKPSGGCYACRERKSRCDKLPEGCTQCARAKRKCPGYRQLGDVIFHNESENVVRKIKAKEARVKAKEAALKETPPTATTSEDSILIVSQPLEISKFYQDSLNLASLLPSIEDRATGFFVSNFVVSDQGPTRGHLDYLEDISRCHILDDGLVSGMRAVGMAGYAHATREPLLLNKARYQYSRALKLTNEALQSPANAKKDSTLLSILVLGIFESITGCREKSLKDWSEHIRGSAAVIKLRGPDQIKTMVGRRMLVQVTSSLSVICLSQGRPLPQYICDYTFEAIKMLTVPSPGLVVQETMILTSQFRAAVFDGTISDPQEILDTALELDGRLLLVAEKPPPGWEYQTVFTDADVPFIYRGRYHIYYDCWVAQVWNALRVVRALLHEMIRTVYIKGFAQKPPAYSKPEHTAQFQLSTDLLYELQNDILSSVPQHLGYIRNGKDKHPLSKPWSDEGHLGLQLDDEPDTPVIRMYGGTFLLFPLWFAGLVDIATDDARKFVIRNLRDIANSIGIQQANVLADSLSRYSDEGASVFGSG